VLIAPDCYGQSLTAVQAAEAIAAGWRRSRPADTLVLAPQSDGGPGLVDTLASRLGGLRIDVVSGPLDTAVTANWVFHPAEPGTAYIECAQACGLSLLGGPPTTRTVLAAHSRGVGQLIEAAVDTGADRIVVGLGGTSCTDGGRGMIDALGGFPEARDLLAEIELIAATDVPHPLLGPMGAARVCGPQQGADPATVLTLERRLQRWAAELTATIGRDVSTEPGGGAGGGIGAALLALGGRRESGVAVVAEQTRLADDIAAAGLIVTGEGRFADQSSQGNVVSAVAAGARRRGVPVLVLAGPVSLDAANQLAGMAAAAAAQLRTDRE
jgi:glycerate kinase